MKNRFTTPEQISGAVENLRPVVTRVSVKVKGVTRGKNPFAGELLSIPLNRRTSAAEMLEVGSEGNYTAKGKLIPVADVAELSYDYKHLATTMHLKAMTELMLALA